MEAAIALSVTLTPVHPRVGFIRVEPTFAWIKQKGPRSAQPLWLIFIQTA
jgi:hypothetical protein